ncbi:MAG TPA: trypsin-like peptidase domain-containing protein [Acetivibrio sp.]|uniref:trypsin-like peptidase domain-containing protein n=1 Tax=Acetivibrio sp. TaxID=1872092 RepID=UPI002BFBC82E|nr:trypsin-like peptidase domain-containing protein [Acetivibrio sp.]HOM01223.1 trypsin-like peptidase domain-containing protein [Acetivibrio sp.]
MKKIFISAGIIVIFLFGLTMFTALGNANIKVLVNGVELNSDAAIINDRVYLPARAVSEALGANVDWDGTKRTVSITLPEGGRDSQVPEVIKSVSPSVVGVIGNLKEDYLYSSGKYEEQIVHGTGVIIKSNGEILTNAHVVKDMEKIVVVLADGSGYEAELKCIDEETDLALIKIGKTGLKPAEFGTEEDIIIGRTVIAIGTPVSFSLRNSASIGIISGVNRSINSSYRLIQTDAAINPGNSGGPLVDLNGKVLGMNSSKFSGIGVEGLGFSIPVGTIDFVLKHFEKYGKVVRPKLGVAFEEDWAAQVGLPTNSGLKIVGVDRNSAAEKYGLLEGDVVLAINGADVNTLVDFNEEMKKYLPNDKVNIKISRKGVKTNVNVVLGN